jgi:HD-GYP domain-containing protein (c-di-GMP phosphodiesterase class II)/fumarate reductase subunit D
MSIEPASPGARRRYPLYVHLSVLFSALVLAAGSAVAWLGYVQQRDTALADAGKLFSHIAHEAQASVNETLQPVRRFAEILAHEPIARARTLHARMQALPLLVHAFDEGAPVAAAYVGHDDGSFFLVRPLRNPAERSAFAAPEGAAFLVQSVEVVPGAARRAVFVFLDPSLHEIGRAAWDSQFDPRERPWYRLATEPGRRILTDPYVFATTGAPGVTVAVRSRDSSVVGLDLTLAQISDHLAALRTLPGMKIVLFDPQRRLLARADVNRTMVRQEGDRVLLATLDRFGEPVLAGLQPLQPGAAAATDLTLRAGGDDWKVSVLPVPTAHELLSLAIAVPLDELLKDARAARTRSLLAALGVLLLSVPLTWWAAHRVARNLHDITRAAGEIRAFKFDGAPAAPSMVLEVDQLSAAIEMTRSTIRRFLDIAASLAAETDFTRLLDRVVRETCSVTGAAAGLVYLSGEDAGTLMPAALVPSGDEPLAAAAPPPLAMGSSPIASALQTGRTALFTVAQEGPAPDLEFVRVLWPGQAVAVVAIPLRDRARQTLGVLVLFSPGAAIPSSERLAFAETLSGTASVAIETQRLLEARKALLDAFIRLVAGAIDAKSPYTGGHCQRVPELTFMLAEAACAAAEGPFKDFQLTGEQWEALHIAGWLHDCGKVTTPEYVVDKATKLETIYDRIHEIRMRFEVLKRDVQIDCWKGIASGADEGRARAELERQLATLDEEFAFVASCNEGGEFMDPKRIERLRQIGARTWLRTLDDCLGISRDEKSRRPPTEAAALPAVERLLDDKPEHRIPRAQADRMPEDNPWGFQLEVPELKHNRGELHNLAIARGTLNPEERYIINHHIVQTIIMLSQLPFPAHLKSVPAIAGGHHEKMDGTGYPMRLKREEMPLTARMMAIADIFEALTAADRPYKKGKTLSEAVKIMSFMKRDQHIDPQLFDLFLTTGVWRRYAERFLPADQVDEVDVAQYVSG